jgi:hypothetical protein
VLVTALEVNAVLKVNGFTNTVNCITHLSIPLYILRIAGQCRQGLRSVAEA